MSSFNQAIYNSWTVSEEFTKHFETIKQNLETTEFKTPFEEILNNGIEHMKRNVFNLGLDFSGSTMGGKLTGLVLDYLQYVNVVLREYELEFFKDDKTNVGIWAQVYQIRNGTIAEQSDSSLSPSTNSATLELSWIDGDSTVILI
jgi:hypothetical protein